MMIEVSLRYRREIGGGRRDEPPVTFPNLVCVDTRSDETSCSATISKPESVEEGRRTMTEGWIRWSEKR